MMSEQPEVWLGTPSRCTDIITQLASQNNVGSTTTLVHPKVTWGPTSPPLFFAVCLLPNPTSGFFQHSRSLLWTRPEPSQSGLSSFQQAQTLKFLHSWPGPSWSIPNKSLVLLAYGICSLFFSSTWLTRTLLISQWGSLRNNSSKKAEKNWTAKEDHEWSV